MLSRRSLRRETLATQQQDLAAPPWPPQVRRRETLVRQTPPAARFGGAAVAAPGPPILETRDLGTTDPPAAGSGGAAVALETRILSTTGPPAAGSGGSAGSPGSPASCHVLVTPPCVKGSLKRGPAPLPAEVSIRTKRRHGHVQDVTDALDKALPSLTPADMGMLLRRCVRKSIDAAKLFAEGGRRNAAGRRLIRLKSWHLFVMCCKIVRRMLVRSRALEALARRTLARGPWTFSGRRCTTQARSC